MKNVMLEYDFAHNALSDRFSPNICVPLYHVENKLCFREMIMVSVLYKTNTLNWESHGWGIRRRVGLECRKSWVRLCNSC
jgi:hypothetical protein